jgi:hypothetical protein
MKKRELASKLKNALRVPNTNRVEDTILALIDA